MAKRVITEKLQKSPKRRVIRKHEMEKLNSLADSYGISGELKDRIFDALEGTPKNLNVAVAGRSMLKAAFVREKLTKALEKPSRQQLELALLIGWDGAVSKTLKAQGIKIGQTTVHNFRTLTAVPPRFKDVFEPIQIPKNLRAENLKRQLEERRF
jgi:hypothetical protein